ncbi:Outer membrane protein TolC [Malonomonas rubra DSM 5091]|uniref:Outer membrane protein TolC n=1 Tax=Malonomonas rubra DSM 5091 TaxID=1122189 RepID=A0A1M6LHD0_MALRU|nr:TolC family protein [Malonomonas rubra]SHJ70567.1 Outer membrane protein TolC [Malonomonas rubra DSM 5091]
MTPILRKILPILVLFLPFQAGAATTETKTLRDLIVLGVEQNIGLQVEQLNTQVTVEALTQNLAVFDSEVFATFGLVETSTPVSITGYDSTSDSDVLNGELGVRKKFSTGLLASLSLFSEWEDDNDSTSQLDPEYRTGLNLSLIQPLLRNYGSEANATDIKIARNRMSQAELQYQLQAQVLALQVEVFAVQLAAGREVVDLRTEAVVLAEELYNANRRRFVTGVIPVSEVQEAETALANRELNLSLSRQEMELTFEDLNRQLNHALPEKFNAASLYPFSTDLREPELPAFSDLFAAAMDKSIALQLADYDVRNASLQQDYFRNQLKPQLDLNMQAGINGLSGNERSGNSSIYSGSWEQSITSAADTDGYQWSVGLEFSMPWENRAAKSRVQQAKLQNEQARYRQMDQEALLKTELKQQQVNLLRAYEQVRLAERFEQLAQLSLQQEQRRLDEGLSDSFRIISFQDNMINARIGRINALAQYFISLAQFDYSRGIILEKHSITLVPATEESSREIM